MIDVVVTRLPSAPLHVFEIWSNAADVGARFKAAKGFALPAMGKAVGTGSQTMIRFEPTVWLVDGDDNHLGEILASDGSLTMIGGGIVRIELAGSGWRRLLMEGGVFDAESPNFAPGCSAATIIDHVNVRLHVVSETVCIAYVPLSFADAMIDFWNQAITRSS